MVSKYDLASYIIQKLNGEITPLKLQKLLYYFYAWSLVANHKLSDCTFYAWKLGPVEQDIYHKYKEYKQSTIPVCSEKKSLNELDKQLIDFITDSYKPYSAFDLSTTTHTEKPWKKTTKDLVITDELMVAFYKNEPFAKNFPLGINKTYIAPNTNSTKSFSFDMNEVYVPEFNSIDDYLAFIETHSSSILMNEFIENLNS